MKLSLKIFLSTVSFLSLLLSLGGYFLISFGFQYSLRREYDRSAEDLLHTRFSFESAVINLSPGKSISDTELVSVGKQLSASGLFDNYSVLFESEESGAVYLSAPSPGFTPEPSPLPADADSVLRVSRSDAEEDAGWYLLGACRSSVGGRRITLRTSRSVTGIFSNKERQFDALALMHCALLVLGGAGIFLLSLWITRPLRRASATARNIAGGDYRQRIAVKSRDEIGQLALDFNRMADSVEDKILALETAARQKEDFVANFAHELKTPLTSIIGYSDTLRSKRLDPETAFTAANYIYNESKRLENLSLKLMDLFVLERSDFPLRLVNAALLLEEAADAFAPIALEYQLLLSVSAEEAILRADPDLLKTLLYNLLDNARKASQPGNRLWLSAVREAEGCRVTVRDEGYGIAKEEIAKLTEPFYMVDKSRARRQHGAGLGLSLCSEICRLHGGALAIESETGAGTSVSLWLPLAPEKGAVI